MLRVGLRVGVLQRERLEKCEVIGHCTECGGWGFTLDFRRRLLTIIMLACAHVRCDAGEVQVKSCMCLKGVGGRGL